MIICCSCAIRGASSGDSCSASATSGKPISSLSTASSTCSSSLSSPGCLNTSSFPLINRLFFNGASCPASLPLPFSDGFPFALSFFFCRFARFLAVLASAASSASFRLLSNSAVSASYQTVSSRYFYSVATYLSRFILHHLQSFVFSAPTGLVNVEFATSSTST